MYIKTKIFSFFFKEKIDVLKTLGADVHPVPAVPFDDPMNYFNIHLFPSAIGNLYIKTKIFSFFFKEKIDVLKTLGADVHPVPAVPFDDPMNYNHQVIISAYQTIIPY